MARSTPKLSDTSKKFSCKFDSKELEQAIAKISTVLGSAPANLKNFLLMSSGGKVLLLAYIPDTFVSMTLKSGTAEGDGAFGFTPATIQGIIKSRGEMIFAFSGTEVHYKVVKGTYSGNVITLPITSDQVTQINQNFESKKEDKKGEGSVLPRHVLDHLKEGVALTGIKDVYTGNALLAYMVLGSKGVLTVSSHDNHHFGHYKAKVKAGGITFRAALPSSHFLIIDKMVEDADAKFFIRSQNIRVEGPDFILILPAHQADEKSFDLIGTYIKELGEPSLVCDYDHDKFIALSDNLFALHSVNTSFDITHKKASNVVGVTFNTSNGSAKDSMKVKPSISKDVSVKVDPRMLRDILGLLRGQGDVSFSIVKDTVVRLTSKTKSGAEVSLISALTS